MGERRREREGLLKTYKYMYVRSSCIEYYYTEREDGRWIRGVEGGGRGR